MRIPVRIDGSVSNRVTAYACHPYKECACVDIPSTDHTWTDRSFGVALNSGVGPQGQISPSFLELLEWPHNSVVRREADHCGMKV